MVIMILSYYIVNITEIPATKIYLICFPEKVIQLGQVSVSIDAFYSVYVNFKCF